jgi:hypothetical protein
MTYSSCNGGCGQYLHSTMLNSSYMSNGTEKNWCNASDYISIRNANSDMYNS